LILKGADIIMLIPDIDRNKLNQAMYLIDEINNAYPDNDKVSSLQSELEKLTGKTNIDIECLLEYWGYTSLEELAKTILMPEPEKSGLSDSQIYDIVKKICDAEFSESETDYLIKVLEKETGLDITDYIYYMDAETDEIAKKILSDRR